MLRYFVIDSMALVNIEKQDRHGISTPDVIEILPGIVLPKIIQRVNRASRVPVLAGGLISDRDDVMNLFIYGNDKYKLNHIMKKYDLSEQKAKEMINKKDKQRQSYYNYYSSKKWGHAASYDLCINSSILGNEGTKNLIIQAIEVFESRRA